MSDEAKGKATEKLLKYYIPSELVEEYWRRIEEANHGALAIYRLWEWLAKTFPEVQFGIWQLGGNPFHPFVQQVSRDTP